MKNEITRLTIDIPTNEHKKLKSIAALTGKSMKEVLLQALEYVDIECLTSDHIPNFETIKAIEKVQRGEDLVKAKDINDLFKKLGI